MDIERINDILKKIVQDINNYNNIEDKKTYTLLEKDDVMLEVKQNEKEKSFISGKKMGIYIFALENEDKSLSFLKIGKANTKSAPRFYNQHYELNSANSTLAKKLFFSISNKDDEWYDKLKESEKMLYDKLEKNLKNIIIEIEKNYDEKNKKFNKDAGNDLKEWIRGLRRINIILDEKLGTFVLNYFEAYLHLIFRPFYEGYRTQSH